MRRNLLLVLALLAMLCAACGSRLSDDQRAALATQRASGGERAAGDLDPGAAGATATTAAAASGGATETTAAAAQGGAGPAAATPGEQAAGAACAASGGETDVGVTAEQVTIGNVSQISGVVPNFGQTGVNGVKAYVDMVNSQGGVCGRTLRLVTADDRFSSATNRSETEKLAGQVLAFVGGTTVVDDGGAPVIEANGIPDVGLALSDARLAISVNYSPSPFDVNAGQGAVGPLTYFKQTTGATTVAVVFQDAAVARARLPNFERDVAAAGMTIVERYPVPTTPTASDFQPVVNDIRQKGIELVYTLMENNAIARLAQVFGDEPPKVPFYGAQAYGKKYLQQAGQYAEGTILAINYAIPEEAASVPAIGLFDQWYKRSNPGADIDFFAIMGWISADMFVRALRDAGGEPTRAKVLAELGKLTDYSGDGLSGRINPAQKQPARCYQVIKVQGGRWVKEHPAQGFQC